MLKQQQSDKLTRSLPKLMCQISVTLIMLFSLGGCDWVVMFPAGDIARQEAQLILIATVLMLLVIVPVIVLTIVFASKYRASKEAEDYDPEWNHSTTLEIVIWTIPMAIILVLGGITFVATHRLDPYAPIAQIRKGEPVPESAETLVIEAVAMDWKWLFFYPDYGIATVNELAAPVDRPIQFKLTSATVMNSLYIPALAGQIYAMAGMETKLHAVINEEGTYLGFSANYSGHGFSDMHFDFHGMSERDFDQWINKVQNQGNPLNLQTYNDLMIPSHAHEVTYYNSVMDGLYHNIMNMCVEPGSVCMDEQMHRDAERAANPPEHGEEHGHSERESHHDSHGSH